MEMPLNVLFWGMEAAYLIHCLDETIAGGGFVNMVKSHFWPAYDAKTRSTMTFGEECKVEKFLFDKEREAWDGLLEV